MLSCTNQTQNKFTVKVNSIQPVCLDVGEMHVIACDFLLLLLSGWKCEVCDLQENLWMNLTDGKVLCGRRYFDGSGGNNHALQHFQQTGYPLAVKLGTITPDGAGTNQYSTRRTITNSIKLFMFKSTEAN